MLPVFLRCHTCYTLISSGLLLSVLHSWLVYPSHTFLLQGSSSHTLPTCGEEILGTSGSHPLTWTWDLPLLASVLCDPFNSPLISQLLAPPCSFCPLSYLACHSLHELKLRPPLLVPDPRLIISPAFLYCIVKDCLLPHLPLLAAICRGLVNSVSFFGACSSLDLLTLPNDPEYSFYPLLIRCYRNPVLYSAAHAHIPVSVFSGTNTHGSLCLLRVLSFYLLSFRLF